MHLLVLLLVVGCTPEALPLETESGSSLVDTAAAPPTADCDGAAHCATCDEAGFWAPTWDIEDPQVLEAVLVDLLSGLTSCHYQDATTWMFTRLDNHDGEVECVYTGRWTEADNEKPNPEDMNTEHTWPQSLGAGVPPARCDVHHLFPSDTQANAVRAAYPFGEVVGGVTWAEGGSQLGLDADGATVFEPRDPHKGPAARAILYFAVTYEMDLGAQGVEVLRDWHVAHPPDPDEIDRTFEIADYQVHANPFIVCPDLVERLWGKEGDVPTRPAPAGSR